MKDNLTPQERRELEHEGQIRCGDCGRWQDDKGQYRCDYWGCTGVFDREE